MTNKPLDTYLNLCTQVYDLSKPNPPKDAYDFYLSYAKEMDGIILEPMCGTGRFLLPLLEEGFEVHGFDASLHMLDALHVKAKAKHLKPNVWQGFIENLKRQEQYGLIFIPSGSFGLIIDLAQAKHALKTIYKHLTYQGVFVFEAETQAAVSSNSGPWTGSVWRKNNGQFIIANFLELPLQDNVIPSIGRYELVDGNEIIKTEIEDFKVRIYEPVLLIQLLKEVGFKDIKTFKAFDRAAAPDENDDVIVYECRK
jgi:SAM-dependent methyltransferase